MSAQYRRTNMRRSVRVLKENERAKLDHEAMDKGMGKLYEEEDSDDEERTEAAE
jgi:hypothetical protein